MVMLIYQRVSLPIKNGMLGYPIALCTLGFTCLTIEHSDVVGSYWGYNS
jgi:hypothetical protein